MEGAGLEAELRGRCFRDLRDGFCAKGNQERRRDCKGNLSGGTSLPIVDVIDITSVQLNSGSLREVRRSARRWLGWRDVQDAGGTQRDHASWIARITINALLGQDGAGRVRERLSTRTGDGDARIAAGWCNVSQCRPFAVQRRGRA